MIHTLNYRSNANKPQSVVFLPVRAAYVPVFDKPPCVDSTSAPPDPSVLYGIRVPTAHGDRYVGVISTCEGVPVCVCVGGG